MFPPYTSVANSRWIGQWNSTLTAPYYRGKWERVGGLIKWGFNLPQCANEVSLKTILGAVVVQLYYLCKKALLNKLKFLQNEAHIYFNVIWYHCIRISHYRSIEPIFIPFLPSHHPAGLIEIRCHFRFSCC